MKTTRPNPNVELAVQCWCRATVVHATTLEIAAGLTRPCTRPACQTLDRRARQAAADAEAERW